MCILQAGKGNEVDTCPWAVAIKHFSMIVFPAMILHSQFGTGLPGQDAQWTAAQPLPEQPWSSGWSKQATIGLRRNVLKVAYLQRQTAVCQVAYVALSELEHPQYK